MTEQVQFRTTDKVTVTLSGLTVDTVMQGLAELPWHKANPAIEEIKAAVFAALAPPKPKDPGTSDPIAALKRKAKNGKAHADPSSPRADSPDTGASSGT